MLATVALLRCCSGPAVGLPEGELGGRIGQPQILRSHPAPVADLQRLDQIRAESL